MISLSNMTPSNHISPIICYDSLKSNKGNDYLKNEEDLFGKSAASLMNSDAIKKTICSKDEKND